MSTRRSVWVIGTLCALSAVGLALVAIIVDLDTGDQVASIAGAVVGLIGCALSVYFGSRPATGRRAAVQAHGRGAVAAGRDVSGNAVGKNARVIRSASTPTNPNRLPNTTEDHEIIARGSGTVAGGDDVTGNAIGEGSEIQER